MPKRIQRKHTKGWKMPPNTVSVTRPGKFGTMEYVAADYEEKFRWKGEGSPPRRWTAPDGTIVYRSYSDYCD